MSNDTTSERLWSFTTATGGDIADAGTVVIVRAIEFRPAAVDDDVVIQEYDLAGSARTGISLKADHAAAEPIYRDFGFRGRRLNGFNLATIDGGTLYVYLGED
jgi:hypothetical protein